MELQFSGKIKITDEVVQRAYLKSLKENRNTIEEYINDVDVIDERCKKGKELEHIDWCTCGIVDLDEEGYPIMYYNKTNQIFLLDHESNLYTPNRNLNIDINNMNVTHKHIYKSMHKKLDREQKLRYIELGKLCEEYLDDDDEKVS